MGECAGYLHPSELEYVDWNKSKFTVNGENMFGHIYSVVPATSFRPTSQTVIRLNYRFQKQTDLLGDQPSTTAGYQFGFSGYFKPSDQHPPVPLIRFIKFLSRQKNLPNLLGY